MVLSLLQLRLDKAMAKGRPESATAAQDSKATGEKLDSHSPATLQLASPPDQYLPPVVAAGTAAAAATLPSREPATRPPTFAVGRDQVTPLVFAAETKAACLALIASAQYRLDITTHAVDDLDYIRAIEAAATRGVTVRIAVSDPRYAGYSRARCAAIRRRLQALARRRNITVCDFPNARLQTGTTAPMPELHAKLVVADERRAYLGDNNLKLHAQNLESGLIIRGPTATRLAKLFTTLWASSSDEVIASFQPKPPPNWKLEILQSRVSDHNVKARLLEDIAAASRSIFVMQFMLSDPEVIQALIDKHRRDPGVAISVLLGRKHGTVGPVRVPANQPAYQALRAAGVDARFVADDRFVHGKLVVVDDRVSHVGSADLMYRSLEGNLEVNARVVSAELAAHFTARLRPFFEAAAAPPLSRRDRVEIALAAKAERAVYSLMRLAIPLRQLWRAFRLDTVVFGKASRIALQLAARARARLNGPKVDLNALTDREALEAEIRARFDVRYSRALNPPSRGVYLVGGHTPKRAQVVRQDGAQMCYNGDIGAGVYLSNDPRAAAEYSTIHGAQGALELVLYQAQIRAPFRLPLRRADYDAWLEDHPSPVARGHWQRLAEFCRDQGYDSVVMEDVEGKGSSYVLVLDPERVLPISHYTVSPKQRVGWPRALRERIKRSLLGRRPAPTALPSARPAALEGSVELSSGARWGFRFDQAARLRYQRRAIEIMQRDRGLRDLDKLNPEIGELDRHIVADLRDTAGGGGAWLRMIPGYDISGYAGLERGAYERWKDRDLMEVAIYPQDGAKAASPAMLEAAVEAARAYRESTGRLEGLYIEVPPARVKLLETLGFEVVGEPFQARAWDGSWVPLLLDLRAEKKTRRQPERAA